MRILNIQEDDNTRAPESVKQPGPAPAAPIVQDNERVDTLEKMTASILQKLNDMDERVTALEKTPTAAPQTSVIVNADAIKKGLMTKMWTYLNDKAA